MLAQSRDRLIVALDVPSATQARQIVQAIGDGATTYKIGKQLFTAEGPQLVRELISSGRKVFLDLKYHDIPNTVGAAVRSAAELGVTMLTVHASGGSKMLKAAVEAAAQSADCEAIATDPGAATLHQEVNPANPASLAQISDPPRF